MNCKQKIYEYKTINPCAFIFIDIYKYIIVNTHSIKQFVNIKM